jgi:hypothetical protein
VERADRDAVVNERHTELWGSEDTGEEEEDIFVEEEAASSLSLVDAI